MSGSEALNSGAQLLSEALYQGEAEGFGEVFSDIATSPAFQLGEATGIDDRDLLERLLGLGIRVETLAALTLVPLIEVAWADGRMERKERAAVLEAASQSGLEPDSTSYKLLDIWTRDRPAPALAEAWREFVAALSAELSAGERARFSERVLARAHDVAAAAGGILGAGPKVSAEEREVLVELKRAFRS
jgi:tellurite resistance protein